MGDDEKRHDNKKKDKLAHHVKKKLSTKVELTVGVLILVVAVAAALILVKIPYNAKEDYIQTETYDIEIKDVVPDAENKFQEYVCVEKPASVDLSEHDSYKRPFGLYDYKCYGTFKVRNQGTTDGKWTYRYIFDISGKEVATEPKTSAIPKLTASTFTFETECLQQDKVSGIFELVSGPTQSDCKYETIIPNKTVTRTETKERQVPKERTMTKYEPLWQKLVGYNDYEKV